MPSALALPAEMTVQSVRDLHESWRTLAAAEDVLCDGAEVTRTSTAGIQLLLSLGRQVEAGRGRFHLQNNSAALNQAIATLGLSEIFTQWSR